MIISRKQMQNIVEELEDTIQKNINIMDETGCIVASTDMSRIGTYHSGAQRVINQKLDELIISESNQYAGAKNGINLPIIIDGKIAGVVGITGKKEEVQVLGKVIQKMTEILIMDHYRNNQKKSMENMQNNFIVSWLFADEESSETEDNLQLRGQLLGIDINLIRTVAVMGVVREQVKAGSNETEIGQELYDCIIREIKGTLKQDAQHLVSQVGTKITIFFSSSNTVEVFQRLESIVENIQKQYKCILYCGIGAAGANRVEIRRSYKEATTACNLAMRIRTTRIKVYSDVDMELFLENISEYEREMFVRRVFKGCNDNEILKWVQILSCYFENNGSITKTAEDCYIHKNTLQYRLSKLKETTGYDPRIIKEAIPLYVAMLIYEFDHMA